ncbi:MAG: undecaprenyl-diphosphate phosphatase, partial [Defluviitaleaceae bacterium]|nr:undecaprenyl-diphosphate phosphatase [Defluviitaleaceae bacterium]
SIRFLPPGFVVTGIILLLSDKLRKNDKDIRSIGLREAALVGCAQALAVFPGISRSGNTITASLAMGLDRENAAKFSFLMSVPAAFGAMIFRMSRVLANPDLIEGLNFANLAAGFATAAVVGYLAINFMLAIIKKAKLKYFALYYVFALAVFMLIFF